VIPCLDFKDGRVVKGVQFVELVDAGDPALMAKAYVEAGADQLAFLDIAATVESRPTRVQMVSAVKAQCAIPFVVGGGMSSLEDINQVLEAGADMISMNSAAVRNAQLVSDAVSEFGSEKIIVAIDAVRAQGNQNRWVAVINGGNTITDVDVLVMAEEVARRGAAEILLTSMDADGAQDGYDLALTRALARQVEVPVIASGGAGKLEHFAEAIIEAEADAVLAASVFHFGTFSIREVKEYLSAQGIAVRMEE